ncbi:hypothetical protein [Paenibacillus durus]|uniref:hypothetical protein n=1 Tax=Paenibacillus durus TaxID=44251 RepID=UPI000B0264FF|nr:hypothetical protein [Paenibacillus durus]
MAAESTYRGWSIHYKRVRGTWEATAIKGAYRENALGDDEKDAFIKVTSKIDVQEDFSK